MDNKEKSPEQELIESIGLMIEKGMESNTNIYTGVVKSVDGKRAVVTVNGRDQNVAIATADVSSGNVVKVFVPSNNMSAAFIIKAESSGGGGTTTNYGDLTNKPSINGNTLIGNKTSAQIGVYGTGNPPPYPVTSVNGQTGDVTIEAGGNVDSVNGKTGTVVLDKSDIGLGNVDNVKQYSASNPPPYPVKSVDGATGAVTTNAVKTIAQSLTNAQKTQARTNIGAGTSSFSGSYNDLTNKPTIPSKTSDLTNDSHYITAAQAPVQSVNGQTGAVQLDILDPYTLPVASSTTLGGVKPVARTSDMTQNVGVDANGALYTAPGGGTQILVDGILEGDGTGNIFAAQTVQAETANVTVGEPFYVNCTISAYDVYDTNVTHDKTYAEIMAAYQAGRPCYAVVEDSVYGPYYLPLVSLNTYNNCFDFALSEPVVESQGSQPYSFWFFIYIGADFAEGYKGSIYIVPYVNEGNEGQFLRVVNGKWAAATVDNANGQSF